MGGKVFPSFGFPALQSDFYRNFTRVARSCPGSCLALSHFTFSQHGHQWMEISPHYDPREGSPGNKALLPGFAWNDSAEHSGYVCVVILGVITLLFVEFIQLLSFQGIYVFATVFLSP